MIPLALCSSNGCPGIWLDDDDVVVQGELLRLISGDGFEFDPPSIGKEALVRIPTYLLRRAAMAMDVAG